MLDRETDSALVEDTSGRIESLPAVQILNERGEYSATQGTLVPWVRPYMRYLDPWFARGLKSVNNLAGVSYQVSSI
jgi:benzoate 4-monooxygenase